MIIWFNHWFSTAYYFIEQAKALGNYVIATNQRDTCVYYKEVYYETISDYQQALDEGYTRIMMRYVLDKDEYFPVVFPSGAAMYNVLGMYINVNPGDLSDTYYISPSDWETRVTDKGTLELISTRGIITRSADQAEDVVILLEF